MDRAKRKCVFEHAQNAQIQIQIHPTHAQSVIQTFLSTDTFYSLVSNDSASGQWPWSDCVEAQADQGFRCPHML